MAKSFTLHGPHCGFIRACRWTWTAQTSPSVTCRHVSNAFCCHQEESRFTARGGRGISVGPHHEGCISRRCKRRRVTSVPEKGSESQGIRCRHRQNQNHYRPQATGGQKLFGSGQRYWRSIRLLQSQQEASQTSEEERDAKEENPRDKGPADPSEESSSERHCSGQEEDSQETKKSQEAKIWTPSDQVPYICKQEVNPFLVSSEWSNIGRKGKH